MLLSDFLTVALIPPLISQITNSSAESEYESDKSSELFTNDDFFQNQNFNFPSSSSPIINKNNPQLQIADPILRQIYEEEQRLDLSGNSDDDMRSEEARELITFQRNKFQSASAPNNGPRGRFLFSSEGGVPFFQGPGNERFNAEYLSSSTAEPPFFVQPTPFSRDIDIPVENVEEEITSRTSKSLTGRLGIGGAFNKVRTGFQNAVGGIKQTFWGSSYKPSSTERPTSPPNTIFFPPAPHESRLPSAGDAADPINFNDHGDSENNRPSENLNCTGEKTEYNGECHNVLQQLPCTSGQWLIEDEATGKGKCVENRCAGQSNLAYFAGDCIQVKSTVSEQKCHRGMTTYIFKNGEVECDCKDNHLFNQRDGNCYPSHRMGPCREGEIFVAKVSKKGSLPASCIKNKCSADGFVCNAPSCPGGRNCIELKSVCLNGDGVFDIDPETLSPKCLSFDKFKPDRIIGNVPTLACAPGSRRDILGTCRKPTKITFS